MNLLYWSQRAPGDRLGNGVKAALDDYVARNPGRVTLEVGEGGSALGMERIKTAIAGGTQPDLYGGLYQSPAVELFALGAVLDLNRELRTDKDWTKSKSELIPSNVDGCSWKGQFVMVPMMLAQQVLGLNRQLMTRAGVPLPAQNFTWNDFVELGRKVVQPGERWLMSWNYTWSAYNSWIYANGLAPLSTDRTKVLYDTPQMLETLQWLHDLATAGQIFRAGPSTVPEFDGGTFVAESVNEAAAMQPPRYPNVDTGDGAGLFVTHFPIGPSNTKRQIITYANTYGLIALKSSDPRKVAAAAALAGWGARAEVQTEDRRGLGAPPAQPERREGRRAAGPDQGQPHPEQDQRVRQVHLPHAQLPQLGEGHGPADGELHPGDEGRAASPRRPVGRPAEDPGVRRRGPAPRLTAPPAGTRPILAGAERTA